MADIDQIIAGGAGSSSRADFSGLGKLLDSYWTGKDQAAKNDLREAFKGGVPTLPDGSPDFGTMAKTLYQKGGINEGNALVGASIGPTERAKLDDLGPPQSAQAPIVSPPSANRTATAVVAPPLNKGGVQGPGQAPQQGGITPASYLDNQGISGYNREVGLSYFKRNGIDPDQPFNPDDPAVASKLGPVLQRLKSVGQVQPPQPGDNQPQQAPQVAQAPPQQPQAPMAPQQASPEQQAAQNDPILKRLTLLTASPDKPTAAAAKVRLEAYLKNQEATGPMKEAAASGLSLKDYQDRQGEQAAAQAGGVERAKADVKEQQEYIDTGRMAGARLGTLNTISNVVASDKNLNLGFGSETSLKIKMALEKAGMDFGDLSGSQLIQKLNGVLASESSKSFSTRPTQFEFKTFLANNPGLSLDEKGNVRMLGILSQTAKREYDLGKLARQNQDNWSNWDNVVEAYDKKNPVKDPTTGKVLSSNSIIAPGTKQGAQPASTAPKQFSSPNDVHAAIASGQLKKGDTFTDANGKTRMVP